MARIHPGKSDAYRKKQEKAASRIGEQSALVVAKSLLQTSSFFKTLKSSPFYRVQSAFSKNLY